MGTLSVVLPTVRALVLGFLSEPPKSSLLSTPLLALPPLISNLRRRKEALFFGRGA